MTPAPDAYRNFRFHVDLGGGTVAGFAQASVLSMASNPHTSPTVTLTHGAVDAGLFDAWASNTLASAVASAAERLVCLQQMDESGRHAARRWWLHAARPTRCVGSPMADQGAVATEVVVLVCERLELEETEL